LQTEEALDALDRVLDLDCANAIVMRLDAARWIESSPAAATLLEGLTGVAEAASPRVHGAASLAPRLVAVPAGPRRRAVLEELRDGPRAVGELAARLPVSRPAVSQHLRVLKEAGLVTERQNGTRRLYRVEPDGLAELREYLEGFWEEALASFKAAAEREEGRKK